MASLNPKYLPPDAKAIDQRWITWYETIESDFGQKSANDAMTRAWTAGRVGSDAKTSALKSYFKTKGLDFDVGTIGNIASNVGDTVGGFTSGIGNFFQMGKTMMIVWFVVIIVLVFIIVWRMARPETARAIISARTGGAL